MIRLDEIPGIRRIVSDEWCNDDVILTTPQVIPNHAPNVVLFKYWGGGSLVVPSSLRKLFNIHVTLRSPQEEESKTSDDQVSDGSMLVLLYMSFLSCVAQCKAAVVLTVLYYCRPRPLLPRPNLRETHRKMRSWWSQSTISLYQRLICITSWYTHHPINTHCVWPSLLYRYRVRCSHTYLRWVLSRLIWVDEMGCVSGSILCGRFPVSDSVTHTLTADWLV